MLLIFELFPVPYRAPVYRRLQELNPGSFCVIYASDFRNLPHLDDGFGKNISWDDYLLAGYPNRVLHNRCEDPLVPWFRIGGSGILSIFNEMKPQRVLLCQLNYAFSAAVYATCQWQGVPLWIRVETQDEAFQRSALKSFFRRIFYRLSYLGVEGALYIGELNRRHLEAYGIPRNQLHRAPYCVENRIDGWTDDHKAVERESLRKSFGMGMDDWVIGFSGKLIAKKDPRLLIDAVLRMEESLRKRVCLFFVGSGELDAELHGLAQSTGVRCKFAGFIDQPDIGRYYLAMDTFVLPSRRMGETWGLVVNEALHAGCSVVMSDAVGSSVEFSHWERVLTFKPGDAAGCARAIESLAQIPRSFDWCLQRMKDYSVEAAALGFLPLFKRGKAGGIPALPKILLVGNYGLDRLQSMDRFASVLETGLVKLGFDVTVSRPKALFGRLRSGWSGIGKWFGYVDKYLIYPFQLRWDIHKAKPGVVHICDHSNSIYVKFLGGRRNLITCHDLLAVRAAKGEFPNFRPVRSGQYLQHLILTGLHRCQRITCVTEATRRDVLRLVEMGPGKVDVSLLGLNYPYHRMNEEASRAVIFGAFRDTAKNGEVRFLGERFILHVGGNPWYKNRPGVLKIYAALRQAVSCAPRLVMVGPQFTPEMTEVVERNQLQEYVIPLSDCSNLLLNSLYSRAEFLLFPSWAEGFGWPVLEAMASGCRVATTGEPPMTEVGGEAAVYFDPKNERAAAAVAAALLQATSRDREERVQSGLRQASHFSIDRMVQNYGRIYKELCGKNSILMEEQEKIVMRHP